MSGFILYKYKVGLGYHDTLSYYKGVEKTKEILGDSFAYTTFQNKRSFYGLIEIACAHTIAYGILIFIITHFLRSLSINAPWSRYFSILLFGLAFLEIFSTFVARYGHQYFSFVRIIVLYSFVIAGSIASLVMIRLSWKNTDYKGKGKGSSQKI